MRASGRRLLHHTTLHCIVGILTSQIMMQSWCVCVQRAALRRYRSRCTRGCRWKVAQPTPTLSFMSTKSLFQTQQLCLLIAACGIAAVQEPLHSRLSIEGGTIPIAAALQPESPTSLRKVQTESNKWGLVTRNVSSSCPSPRRCSQTCPSASARWGSQ